jgi:acyl-CoA thioester hydrolase
VELQSGGYAGRVRHPFRHRIRVRWAECDQQGVVFYPHYLAYFDIAMTELWREAFGSYGSMIEAGTDMVVAEATVRYRASARFDDELDLTATVTRLGRTSLTTLLGIERTGAGTPLVDGELRHVFVDAATMDKKQVPGDLRRALEPYAARGAETVA